MSALIRIDEVPAADRLDVVQGIASTTWVPMECRSECQADYWGEFRVSGLGAMRVVVLDIMPITVRRTPELISRLRHLQRPAALRGGLRRRPEPAHPAADLHVLAIPAATVPEPGQAAGRRAHPGRGGLGELTSQFLLQLARNIDHCSPAEAARLSTAALEILATGLAHELEVRDWGTPEARRHALLTAVQAFIGKHLGDPGLSPAAIAAAHHISLRSLHQLFHGEGLTVAGWIRRRRLEACRRDLDDPDLALRPVAAIAARWVFSSAGDFSRVFRAAHGLPPAEYRRLARVVKDSAP